jgi:hypothetical protein
VFSIKLPQVAVFQWIWRGHLPIVGGSLIFFIAMDKQVGEKGGKVVYYVNFVPKSPNCYSISVPNCSRIVLDMHWYEARKGDPQTCPNRDLMQMMSTKNIAFTFLFRSPDQETCPGYFTYP